MVTGFVCSRSGPCLLAQDLVTALVMGMGGTAAVMDNMADTANNPSWVRNTVVVWGVRGCLL